LPHLARVLRARHRPPRPSEQRRGREQRACPPARLGSASVGHPPRPRAAGRGDERACTRASRPARSRQLASRTGGGRLEPSGGRPRSPLALKIFLASERLSASVSPRGGADGPHSFWRTSRPFAECRRSPEGEPPPGPSGSFGRRRCRAGPPLARRSTGLRPDDGLEAQRDALELLLLSTACGPKQLRTRVRTAGGPPGEYDDPADRTPDRGQPGQEQGSDGGEQPQGGTRAVASRPHGAAGVDSAPERFVHSPAPEQRLCRPRPRSGRWRRTSGSCRWSRAAARRGCGRTSRGSRRPGPCR
jgi:hypothetical protein